MSIEMPTRVPMPNASAAMVKLTHGARARTALGWSPAAGDGPPPLTQDGFGVHLYPDVGCLMRLSTPVAAAAGGDDGDGKKKKAKAGASATAAKASLTVPKGTSMVIECGAMIKPLRGWAMISTFAEPYGGVAIPTATLVPKGTEYIPRFVVMAVDADVTIDEDLPLGIAALLA